MGKLYDSLLSGTSGRTGRIVVANVYGNEITRIRPRKRTSAPSLKQQLIQMRMKMSADFMASYRTYACLYFGTRVGMKSPFNLAMTNVMENFVIDYVAETITPNYAGIAFSKGKLLGVAPEPLQLPAATTLEVNWSDNSGGNITREGDLAQILIAAENEVNTFFSENTAPRNAGSATVTLPSHLQGKTLNVWLAFRSADESLASSSLYLGTI